MPRPSGNLSRWTLAAHRRHLHLAPLDRRGDSEAVAIFSDGAPRHNDVAPCAGARRSRRPTAPRPDSRRRSSAGCAGARIRPNGPVPARSRRSTSVKKYFISNRPRGVWMNLCEVARETVDSCTPIASPTIFRLSGRRPDDALEKEAVLPAHDLARDVEDGARALLEALGQPVGGLQIGWRRIGGPRRAWRRA